MRRIIVIGLTVVTAIVLPATTANSGPPTILAISSPTADPFTSCTADFPQFQPGTLYSNSEVEPFLAVNPANEQNLVSVWQQDRWSNAASRGIVAATSSDGGATWTTVTATKTSLCTGGTDANGGAMFRASNPWLTFSPDGTAYLISVGIPFFNQGAVLVNRSSDGGRTWSDPVALQVEANNAMNDKPTITADPADSDYAYAVWTRNEFPQEQAAPIAAEESAASRGPVWFARTIDGGRNWQAAHGIYDPGERNGTLGHQIAVLPTNGGFHGELVDVFEVSYGSSNAHGQRGVHIAAIRSTDKGTTWSDATEIADALPVPFVDPLTGTRIRTGANIPDIAIDSRNGTLYAAWLDARFSGGQHNDIALSMSTDGGLTWTAPVRANLTPSVAEPVSRNAFTPSVQVSADGTVGVSYYDLRNNHSVDSATQPLATDRFLARCARPSASVPDLCASGWTETRLTPESFNLRAAPNSVGLFLGGNQGLASVGNTFLALFAQANDAADPTTIYFASVP